MICQGMIFKQKRVYNRHKIINISVNRYMGKTETLEKLVQDALFEHNTVVIIVLV